MHGLRCSHKIAGFTRLLDEWVIGLNAFAHKPALSDPGLFLESFTRAATNVRSFAWGADKVEPTVADDAGNMRMELQGRPYFVTSEHKTVSSVDALRSEAPGWLEAAAARSAAAAEAAGDEMGVGVIFVTVEAGDRVAYRDLIRELPSTGSAWSFPSDDLGPEYDYAGEALGGIVLAATV